MLNTTHIKMGSNTSNVILNTPSTGMMQRSHPKSFFIRFALGSKMEKKIFPNEGVKNAVLEQDEYPYKKTEINVLQILIFGENYYFCEVVKVEDLTEDTTTP